jgi:hypothetical protein
MAAGWSGALAISRSFTAMLFGVGPLDLLTWIVVSGCMLGVASIASYLLRGALAVSIRPPRFDRSSAVKT